MTEIDHTQKRLENIIEQLGNEETSARIDAAHKLYYLAKDNKNCRETVCDILCKHIRKKTQEKNYKEAQEDEPSEEIQTFLNLLCGKDKGELFSKCQINLSSSFLKGADLREAHLRGANLLKAHLRGADLSGAQLQKACLSGAHLRGADLSGAQLWKARLLRTQLQEANLSGAQLQWADLSEAQLRGEDLSEAHLRGVRLSGAQLQGANLSGTKLWGADLSGAQLWGADLSGAQLQKACLSGAHLRGASLSGAQLWEANLSGAQLQGANLSEAHLQEASLSGAQLQGISSSEHYGGNFQDRVRARIGEKSDFTNVVFSGGLNAEQAGRIIESMMPVNINSKGEVEIRNKPDEHVGKEASNKLPDNSGAITGTYSQDEAEKWIAEYEESIKLSA